MSGLSYQRWAVRVKNTSSPLNNDQVDRELGASLGTGITHVLFVAPRSHLLTSTATAEIVAKSRISPLHILYLTNDQLEAEAWSLDKILRALREQAMALDQAKSTESERRES